MKGNYGTFQAFEKKPSLTLNFDKFNEHQKFHGMDKLHLNNSVQDPSYMTEIICGDLFRAAGVPATRGAHARVFLNGRDLGLYVLKFRGAGQGSLALVAELMAGEIGRALGLNVPELVFVEVDAALGRNEPDEEVRDLLNSSVGLNLALDQQFVVLDLDPRAFQQTRQRGRRCDFEDSGNARDA